MTVRRGAGAKDGGFAGRPALIWSALWAVTASSGDAGAVLGLLTAAYGEPHRAYHGAAHIRACLDLALERLGDAAIGLDEMRALQMALFWHDVVYDPRRTDNERRSADVFRGIAAYGGMAASFIERVDGLIMATAGHDADATPAGAAMLGIDLAALGAPDRVYDAYAAAIRREYAFVPERDYRAGRAAVLRRFLDRPRIFVDPICFDRYESAARNNISREIASLTDVGDG